MNVLMLAAQNAQTGMQEEAELPICLTEVDGKPLLELLTEAVQSLKPTKIIFAFMKQDIAHWGLDYIVEQLAPGSGIISVEKPTAGAACTALLGTSYIDNDEELLIISANELVRINLEAPIESFRKSKSSAGVLSFRSVHPRYAYVKLSEEGTVIEASEKRVISRNALTGIFWFEKGSQFIYAAKEVIRKNATFNSVFYISSTLNEIILNNCKINIYNIEKDQYLPLKTERQKELAEIMSMN